MAIVSSRQVSCAAALIVVCTLTAATAWAGGRPNDSNRNWFGDVSLGWASPQGDANDVLDDDFTIGAGVLYWPSDWPVGLQLDVTYASFDFSGEALARINDAIDQDPDNDGDVTGGDVETWQFLLNGIWSPGNRENGLYFSGGVGAYHLDAALTDTGIVYYPPICDPWYWWWCVPGGFGPGTIVRGSDSTTEFGWNAGVGYDFPAGEGKVFVEAKYHFVTTDSEDLYFIPITVGYRW